MNQVKYGLYALLAFLIFFSGWSVNDWHRDSKELAIQEAILDLQEDYHETEKQVSRTLENTLKELKANERVIERETVKVIERPVYRNECLDDDGVQILNRQRGDKEADSTEPTS